MATYLSILTKCEDAVQTAFEEIAGADLIPGVTIYKGGTDSEVVPPAISILAVSAVPMEPDSATICSGENYSITVEIAAITNPADSGRTAESNIAGLLEAVLFRSADQMLTELNAAGVTEFHASRYHAEGMTRSMDDDRRTTTATISIGAYPDRS